MSLRTTIHAVLAADGDVTALIGAEGRLRHYPERAPQGAALPYLISNEITGTPLETHGTASDTEDTLDETDIQFTAFAETVAETLALRAAVRAAFLEDAAGLLAAAHIVVCNPVTRFTAADEVDLHGAQLDLTFFHNPNT